MKGKNVLIRLFLILIFIHGFGLMFTSEDTISMAFSIGLFLVIIGIIVGYYNLKKNLDQKNLKELYRFTYNLFPFLIIVAALLFIVMVLVGIKESRIDIPIIGTVMSLIGLFIAFWCRKVLEKL